MALESMFKELAPSERIRFQCSRCGDCCRHQREAIPLDPMDAFCLAKHLRCTIVDFLERYAEFRLLNEVTPLPVYFMKTVTPEDACVFLDGNSCSVQLAKPKACRQYPFSATPKDNGNGFQFFVASDHAHHFHGRQFRIKSWMSTFFTREEREAALLDADMLTEIREIVQGFSQDQWSHAIPMLLFYRFLRYSPAAPFLPQFSENHKEMMSMLKTIENPR